MRVVTERSNERRFFIFDILKVFQSTNGTESEAVASFRYWQEALDYKDYANSRGATVIIRTWLKPDKYEDKLYEAKCPTSNVT